MASKKRDTWKAIGMDLSTEDCQCRWILAGTKSQERTYRCARCRSRALLKAERKGRKP